MYYNKILREEVSATHIACIIIYLFIMITLAIIGGVISQSVYSFLLGLIVGKILWGFK